MDWQTAYYVKLYRSQSPDWLALSPLTRGLFDELLLIADQRGRIQLGKVGLASVAVPLRGAWAEIEPHLRALLADGCLVEADGALLIRGFVEAQRRAKTPAERKAKQRESAGKTPANADASQHAPAERDAPSLVTSSHDESRAVTQVTTKNRSDQKENTPLPPVTPTATNGEPTSAARRDGASPSEPTAPTEGDIVRAYVRGVENATASPFGRKLDADDRGQLVYLWELYAEANEAPIPADFLGRLTDRVAEWVRGKNNPTDRKFQAGWAVKRFVAWLQEQSDGAQDAPEAAPPVSPWGDPTPDELAALRATQGAA